MNKSQRLANIVCIFLGKSKENCTEEPSVYSEQVNLVDAMLNHDSNVLDGQPSLKITESSKNVEC